MHHAEYNRICGCLVIPAVPELVHADSLTLYASYAMACSGSLMKMRQTEGFLDFIACLN